MWQTKLSHQQWYRKQVNTVVCICWTCTQASATKRILSPGILLLPTFQITYSSTIVHICANWKRHSVFHGEQYVCQSRDSKENQPFTIRATAITTLFAANVPEKVIKERTGHCSLEGLWMYEQSTEIQHQAASKSVMSINNNINFQTTIQ